jgi:outer membrane receptor for ferrienterochelin and colicin
MCACFLRTLTVLSILLMWMNKAGAEDNEDHFGLDEQYYNEMVTLASGYLQNVSQSPATVAVITQKDIERIGAVTIEEVLETIPGIHVNYASGFFPTYNIRGIGSTTNSQVLIYLDGIAINTSAVSNSQLTLSHLAKNIERIEIIKGPGSALYGADAYSGVINIITTKKEGTDMGTFAGSFDSIGGWLNHGQQIGDFKINFSAQGATTNGSQGIIQEDRQSQIDKVLGTNASLAPGPINRGRDEIDIKFEALFKDTANLYLRYIHNVDYGMGAGVADSLDNTGRTKSDAWVTGFKFKFGPEDWETNFNINYTGYVASIQQNVFPAGAVGGLFNTPVMHNFGHTAHELSTQLETVYRRIDNHVFHVGLGFEYDSIDDIHDERNFIQGPFNTLLPIGSLQPVEKIGALPIVNPESRNDYYGFIQDEWQIVNDLTLTAGVRLDYFSDFGLTVNPRASLVWDVSQSFTTKLMYGRAFRAPSFFELRTNPGITVTGNPDLDPETIDMVELSFLKTWQYNLQSQLNLFWYQTDNLITERKISGPLSQSESRIFNNSQGANTYGLETELSYQILDNLNFNVNYTYLNINPNSPVNDQFIITAPRHEVYAEINWEFFPDWFADLRSTSVLGRERATQDSRDPIKNYTQLDFTLRSLNIADHLDLTFNIKNLLDADVRDPSIDGNAIPYDFPLAGRSFMGIVAVKF